MEDSAYSHNLKFYESNIVQYVNTICQKNRVNQIRFQVGFVPTLQYKKIQKKVFQSVEKRILQPKFLQEAQEKSKSIQDPKLKVRFSKWMANSLQKRSGEV